MIRFAELLVKRRRFHWAAAFLAAALVSPESAGAPADYAAMPATSAKRGSAYAKSAKSRVPVRAFATELGVYEIDSALSSGRVRVWQRGGNGSEVLSGGFSGKDPQNGGSEFKTPVGLAKHPSENKFAVVCGGEYVDSALVGYCPSVQVYDFAETAGADGTLSSVEITFANRYSNAFHAVTNGVSMDVGSVDAVSTEYFVHVTDSGLVTNSVPASADENETFYAEDPAELGEEYDVGMVWSAGTETSFKTNYVFSYQVSTNANYLASATDVAFAGDTALIVSISGDERYHVAPGFVVFDVSDPAKPGKLVTVANLSSRIAGIAVDQDTGDVYAAVPGSGAVFRVSPDGGWDSVADGASIEADPVAVVGVAGEKSVDWPHLSNPVGVSVWKPGSLGESLVLAVDDSSGRVVASDVAGNPLFFVKSFDGSVLNRPSGVCGIDGEDFFVVADKGGSRTLVCKLDFSGFESDEILSFSASSLSGLGEALVFPENDTAPGVVTFTVAPSRTSRTYSLSVEDDPTGSIAFVEDTVEVPAGETSATFSFYGRDGLAPDGGVSPVSVIGISSGSFSTNVAVTVANVAPVIDSALVVRVEVTNADETITYENAALRAIASDVEADSGLRYLWWATTNVNWALNNLYWAATNNDWEATASSGAWTLLGADDPAVRVVTNYVPYATGEFTVVQGTKWIDNVPTAVATTNYFVTTTQKASFFAEQTETAAGVVTNGVTVYVAKGRQVAYPKAENGYGAGFDGEEGVDFPSGFPATGDAASYGQVVVLTVLDKDGAAAVVTWPYFNDPTGVSRWGVTEEFDDDPDEPPPPPPPAGDAAYSAVFTAISPTSLSFRVTCVSGTPAAGDTVSLHASSDVAAPQADWPVAAGASQTVFPVGQDISAAGESAEYGPVDIPATEDAVFYSVHAP